MPSSDPPWEATETPAEPEAPRAPGTAGNGGNGGAAIESPDAAAPPTTSGDGVPPSLADVADFAEVAKTVGSAVLDRFRRRQMIKSFNEFMRDFAAEPLKHTRSAAQYLLDMFLYFGSRKVRGIDGPTTRWNVFDAPWSGGKGCVRGQERAQQEVAKFVKTFAEKGRVDKLLLLHGPNGSAKSTTVECIMKGLELFSREPEGTLYQFNWIFSESGERGRLGFASAGLSIAGTKAGRESLAHLEPEDVSSRIVCDLRDNPIHLIPKDERAPLVREAFRRKGLPVDRVPPHVLEGELCQKCREIFDALLNAFAGDFQRVVAHVQVERFFISKRYRFGAVVIEPQRNVDASSRPVNFDHQMRIPPILQNANLFEPFGDLIDANRGIVEYSDFFKRPVETNKYLLTTVEKNTINLPNYMAYLDLVMTASSDEKNLNVFKRDPDFSSFKGRFELIKVPYVLEFSKEERIYGEHVRALARHKHVAPYTARIAALWAVLTRLKRPRSKNYPGNLGNLVGKLTPIEKAYLYDQGRPPDEFTDQEKREILSNIEKVRTEFEDHEEEFEGLLDAAYEGRRGASPREMLTLLSDAAAYPEYRCLSPLAVLKALRDLVRDVSVYDFLRLTPQSGYNDNPRFIDDVEGEYRKWVEEEVQDAMDLVAERAYARLFDDYFANVKAFCRGEKVRNRQTGDLRDPDEDLMGDVERVIDVKEKPETFRRNLVTRIAAYSIENPGQKIDTTRIFGDIFKALKTDFYRKREKQIETVLRDVLKFGTDEWRSIAPSQRKIVIRSIARLKARYGYCLHCAKEVVAYVLKHRSR